MSRPITESRQIDDGEGAESQTIRASSGRKSDVLNGSTQDTWTYKDTCISAWERQDLPGQVNSPCTHFTLTPPDLEPNRTADLGPSNRLLKL